MGESKRRILMDSVMGGDYPRGKLCDDDEGAVGFIIGVKEKTVVIAFPKAVTWIGLDVDTTKTLIEALRARVEEIEGDAHQGPAGPGAA